MKIKELCINSVKLASFKKEILATVIAMIFSSLLLLLGKKIVGMIIGVEENFYLKYYYNIVNGENAGSSSIPDYLTIVDVKKYSNRQDVAKILKKVYNYQPQIIGLDVFFYDNPDIKEEVNQELISVLRDVSEKTVVICNHKTDEKGDISLQYPFFKDSVNNLIYTSPLVQSFYNQFIEKDTIIKLPRFSFEVARRSQMPIRENFNDIYVNYSTKNLLTRTECDSNALTYNNIHNKIVLIGNTSEMKDLVRLPFRFGSKKVISGIEDHAYSLISIINADTSSSNYSKRFEGLKELPNIFSLLMTAFITFVFCYICNKYNRWKKNTLKNVIGVSKSKFKGCIVIILHPMIFIGYEVLITLLCYLFTNITLWIPNLFLSMVSIAVVGVSIELTNQICKK